MADIPIAIKLAISAKFNLLSKRSSGIRLVNDKLPSE